MDLFPGLVRRGVEKERATERVSQDMVLVIAFTISSVSWKECRRKNQHMLKSIPNKKVSQDIKNEIKLERKPGKSLSLSG